MWNMKIFFRLKLKSYCRMIKFLPNHNNNEIEQIPVVSQIRVRVKTKSIGDYFKYTFTRKYCQEKIFEKFLLFQKKLARLVLKFYSFNL